MFNKDKILNGKVYTLSSPQCEKYYIGSTTVTLCDRLQKHIESYEEWLTTNFETCYLSSFEILKYGDYKIELLEDCPQMSWCDIEKREQYYQIVHYKDIVNILIAGLCFYKRLPFPIETDDIYTCVCGCTMKNKYSVRRAHSIHTKHRTKVRNIHLLMASSNPAFELIEVEQKRLEVINGKEGIILNINW